MTTPKTFSCKFCKANLHMLSRRNWGDEDYDNTGFCQSCMVHYELYANGMISSFYLTRGDFFLEFNEDDTFTLTSVDDDYNERIILTLPYWPDNITPQNLDEKIKLFKTFG